MLVVGYMTYYMKHGMSSVKGVTHDLMPVFL